MAGQGLKPEWAGREVWQGVAGLEPSSSRTAGTR